MNFWAWFLALIRMDMRNFQEDKEQKGKTYESIKKEVEYERKNERKYERGKCHDLYRSDTDGVIRR
ncbi:MAG: hypothetical protein LIP12_09510 [Clostridiales bacterium]|nr:hypothetical protein [Clostridiales bacterium]